MKIAIKTFGCKANSHDTDALFLEANRRGFDVVREHERADAYVINSCTVTGAADRDARLQANRFKRQNPLALVAVIGCYAQVAKEQLLALPEVDLVVGTANKFRVLDLLSDAMERADWQRDQVENAQGFLPRDFPGSRHARATIKIQDGCNFSCSFCIIPQARGRSRSLPLDDILRQIQDAYEQGFREVVLTGIHIAHYGWDLGTSLLTLLRRVFETEGPRVRLSTLDPFEIPDDLIQLAKENSRFCPHFHIALQSGSDRVLRGMRRIYSAREFTEVTHKIVSENANTFIGVDMIAGFPGEDAAAFEETLACLVGSAWTKLHVFPFSLRKGTSAEKIPHRVRPEQIRERVQRLQELSESRYEKFLRDQSHTEHELVVERASVRAPDRWYGHTENYVPVVVVGPNLNPRSLIRVTLQEREGERVRAQISSLRLSLS